jgi:hypothetical protein
VCYVSPSISIPFDAGIARSRLSRRGPVRETLRCEFPVPGTATPVGRLWARPCRYLCIILRAMLIVSVGKTRQLLHPPRRRCLLVVPRPGFLRTKAKTPLGTKLWCWWIPIGRPRRTYRQSPSTATRLTRSAPRPRVNPHGVFALLRSLTFQTRTRSSVLPLKGP